MNIAVFSPRRRAVDFVSDRTTVNPDLHKVCLLLAETGLADLGVYEDMDDNEVFADMHEFVCDEVNFYLVRE